MMSGVCQEKAGNYVVGRRNVLQGLCIAMCARKPLERGVRRKACNMCGLLPRKEQSISREERSRATARQGVRVAAGSLRNRPAQSAVEDFPPAIPAIMPGHNHSIWGREVHVRNRALP